MLRIHLLYVWSNFATEETLSDTPVVHQSNELDERGKASDETTILNLCRVLETGQLAAAMFKRVNAHLAREGTSLRFSAIVMEQCAGEDPQRQQE